MKSKMVIFLVVFLCQMPLLRAQLTHFESSEIAQTKDNDFGGRHKFVAFTCSYLIDYDRKILSVMEGEDRVMTRQFTITNITTSDTSDYIEFKIELEGKRHFLLRFSLYEDEVDNLLYFDNDIETVHYKGVAQVLYSKKTF